jgi:uncharacterized protein
VKRNELDSPLGLEPSGPERGRRFWPWMIIGGCVLGALYGATAYFAPGNGGDAGISVAVIRPSPSEPRAKASAPTIAVSDKSDPASAFAADLENGVRVIRGGDPKSSGGDIIRVPRGMDAVSEGLPAAPDPRLVENGPFGPLPKVSADGKRPFDAYRRPANSDPGSPRIALIVTGLGLNRTFTRLAVKELPPEMTLAFAPIGGDLWDQSAEARAAGHELLLEAPMEPLATNDRSAWPHELSTQANAARNLQELRWSMSRFPGYFGIINFLGSKLTADRSAITPILQEIAARGLAYVDDGTSTQSLAPAIAGDLQMPAARADVVIDPTADPDALDAELAQLETIAKAQGSAIGVAPGLPDVVDRLSRFVDELSSAGFALVPASALATASPALSKAAN